MRISAASVLNEQARLAMFHPHGRGKTSDRSDCQDWPVKSREIVGRLLEAFESYQPVHVGKMLNETDGRLLTRSPRRAELRQLEVRQQPPPRRLDLQALGASESRRGRDP